MFITELVNSGNAISKLLLQTLPSALPKAHIGIVSHSTYCRNIRIDRQRLLLFIRLI